ncbi:MAG: chemotaxis protein CheX [Deltaproteobacteria bacterium]|nr:chemotaxis protein CheX [Deltaproteobacteria bacterium]
MKENPALISAMMASISEVLETMFFMPLEFSEDAQFEDWWTGTPENVLVTRLTFNGPFSGTFYFFIPEELGRSLAANFMGEDEDAVKENHVTDTVKEIANMIVGGTFAKWDAKAVFDLGIPENTTFGEAEKHHGASENKVFIGITTLDDTLAAEMIMNS